MSNNSNNPNSNHNSNKLLSQGSSFAYFKKIGKKRSQFLVLNIVVALGIVASAPHILKGIEEKTLTVETLITNKDQEKAQLELKYYEVTKLREDLEKEKVVENEFDITLNVFDTLSRIEQLMIKSGFNNTKHEVGSLNYLSDHVELPVSISIVGNYFDIINFLKTVKSWEHSPALRNFELAVNEEEYDSLKVGDKMEVTFDLILYSRLPANVDNTKKFFKGENKFVNPFGYISYTSGETSDAEGISEYQKSLDEYFKRINGESGTNGTTPATGTTNLDGTTNSGVTTNTNTVNPDGTTNSNVNATVPNTPTQNTTTNSNSTVNSTNTNGSTNSTSVGEVTNQNANTTSSQSSNGVINSN